MGRIVLLAMLACAPLLCRAQDDSAAAIRRQAVPPPSGWGAPAVPKKNGWGSDATTPAPVPGPLTAADSARTARRLARPGFPPRPGEANPNNFPTGRVPGLRLNKYGLTVLANPADYLYTVARDSNSRMVPLQRYIPDIKLDIRYATANNFTGQAQYAQPGAYLRLAAARKLALVQRDLRQHGMGLLVYDAYRPYSVTEALFKAMPIKHYVATPWDGSRHNRGAAIDVGLWDFAKNAPAEMPTEFDDFSEKAHAWHPDVSAAAKKNRELLASTMRKHGFYVFPHEWWHFDFSGWQHFELLDIPFYLLEKP